MWLRGFVVWKSVFEKCLRLQVEKWDRACPHNNLQARSLACKRLSVFQALWFWNNMFFEKENWTLGAWKTKLRPETCQYLCISFSTSEFAAALFEHLMWQYGMSIEINWRFLLLNLEHHQQSLHSVLSQWLGGNKRRRPTKTLWPSVSPSPSPPPPSRSPEKVSREEPLKNCSTK